MYVVMCKGQGLVVDCGCADASILEALSKQLVTLGVKRLIGIVATHYHLDHTAGMQRLSQPWHAPLYIHPIDAGQASRALDVPAIVLQAVPERFVLGGIFVDVQHQPGHTHGHVHLTVPVDGVVLVGDHLSGSGSVWVGPPDGHMDRYYGALENIGKSRCRVAGPGHGPAIYHVQRAAASMLARRLQREQQIIALVAAGECSVAEIQAALYGDIVHPDIQRVARRTLLGHLDLLLERAQIRRRFVPNVGFIYVPSART